VTLDATTVDPLIDQLAELPDDVLETAVKFAKKKRAQALKDRIPKAQIESMQTKYKRFVQGQVTSFVVKPEIMVTIKVQAEHEYGSIADYKFELVNDKDRRAKALFELVFDDVYFDDPHVLTKLEPHLDTMMEQETAAHDSWEDDYRHILNEFGVDPFEFLKDDALCSHRNMSTTEKGFKWCPDCQWTDDDDTEVS